MARTARGFLGLLLQATAVSACAGHRENAEHARTTQTELACTYTYGGESVRLSVPPTRDPYRVRSQTIEDRFEFKVVHVAAPADIAGVRIYTYRPTPEGPILIHEAKYRLPYADQGLYGFTGRQLVYEPRGAELEYHCQWTTR